MATAAPITTLDRRFSSPTGQATSWDTARGRWAEAELYWLSTVRPDGRPHVTPLISVWLDGAAYICTGPDECKARNMAQNDQVVMTTGSNALNQGLDLVIEGSAELVDNGPNSPLLPVNTNGNTAPTINSRFVTVRSSVRAGARSSSASRPPGRSDSRACRSRRGCR